MKLTLVPPSSNCLWTPTQKVTAITTQVLPFIDDMKALMEEKQGLGLSANQCGLSFSWFIWRAPEGISVVINPIITERSGWNSSMLEGCLSFPERHTYVARNTIIRATWTDEKGVAFDQTLTMMWARVFSHECQHLAGDAIFNRP